MTDAKETAIQLPEIFETNLPDPTEIAAQFRGAFGKIYAKIEADIEGSEIDLTTKAGRDRVISRASRIAKLKVGMEKAANSLTEGQKAMVKVVIAERKAMSAKMDQLRDLARKPATDWQAAESKRVAIIDNALEYLRDTGRVDTMTAPAQIKDALIKLDECLAATDWQEHQPMAQAAHALAFTKFTADLSASENRIADEKELAELRELKAEQERKDAAYREEQERKDAQAAEERAKQDRDRAAKESAEQAAADQVKAEQARAEQAEARAKQAEIDAEAAKARAEADRIEAAKKAEADKARAEDFARTEERNRLARIEQSRIEHEEARAKDKQNQKRVNSDALKALMTCGGITEEQGKSIVAAIVNGRVPHVKISY